MHEDKASSAEKRIQEPGRSGSERNGGRRTPQVISCRNMRDLARPKQMIVDLAYATEEWPGALLEADREAKNDERATLRSGKWMRRGEDDGQDCVVLSLVGKRDDCLLVFWGKSWRRTPGPMPAASRVELPQPARVDGTSSLGEVAPGPTRCLLPSDTEHRVSARD